MKRNSGVRAQKLTGMQLRVNKTRCSTFAQTIRKSFLKADISVGHAQRQHQKFELVTPERRVLWFLE